MKPITVLVCALGGEGGGVLAEWLYGAAVRAGHAAQASSIPGVAQRTGATTYYLEIAPEPATAATMRAPVFSLSPVPGGIDLLVSSELLETLRQTANGFVDRERTTVISSTARALTVAEKALLADGRADGAALIRTLLAHAKSAELIDLDGLARQAGTVVSAVMLGAIAASGVLPFGREVFEDTVREGGKGVDASLRGFALAFDAIRARREQQAVVAAALAPPVPPAPAALAAAGLASLDLRALARRRLLDYQDAAYVRLFDERLARVAAVDDARGSIAEEAMRWLALWMAFDDLVHVARLKLATSRQQRVRREVKAGDGDVIKVFDHFKPGVAEFASLLPERLAQSLVAWDRRRVARGREPWALTIRLPAHSVLGALALRVLASLKGWRRRGQRFAHEQALIERWLDAIERGAREDLSLGLEIARCGRLVKGYGSTNERGKERLLHVIDHLAAMPGKSPAERAEAIRAAREAALKDDSGAAFDQALADRGAPPRALREQPVRWYKRSPTPSTLSPKA